MKCMNCGSVEAVLGWDFCAACDHLIHRAQEQAYWAEQAQQYYEEQEAQLQAERRQEGEENDENDAQNRR